MRASIDDTRVLCSSSVRVVAFDPAQQPINTTTSTAIILPMPNHTDESVRILEQIVRYHSLAVRISMNTPRSASS